MISRLVQSQVIGHKVQGREKINSLSCSLISILFFFIYHSPLSNNIVVSADMGGRRCRVVFSYTPQHDDELPLCVGQTITVLQEVEEGWWKGVLDGQVSEWVTHRLLPLYFYSQ